MSSFGTASANPWVQVLDALEKKVNRNSYETWLKPTRYDHAQGAILFVRVPNPEFCHIGERYGDLISEAIENLGSGVSGRRIRNRRRTAQQCPVSAGG